MLSSTDVPGFINHTTNHLPWTQNFQIVFKGCLYMHACVCVCVCVWERAFFWNTGNPSLCPKRQIWQWKATILPGLTHLPHTCFSPGRDGVCPPYPQVPAETQSCQELFISSWEEAPCPFLIRLHTYDADPNRKPEWVDTFSSCCTTGQRRKAPCFRSLLLLDPPY